MNMRLNTATLLLSTGISLQGASAQRKYAVYYNPNDEPDRNPMGAGFEPKGPNDWDQVNYYEGFSTIRTVDYGANVCTKETLFSNIDYTLEHQQSPIEVEDGPYWGCNDRHTTQKFGGNDCRYSFGSTPYGLIGKFDCSRLPYMDMSRTTTWWELDYVEMKTPAEHVIGQGDGPGGPVRRYDGEMRLVHKGTVNENADHSGRIAVISVLLDAQGSSNNADIEPYIKRWEAAQDNDYKSCNKEFNDSTCRIRNSRKNRRGLGMGDETEVEPEFNYEGFIKSLTEDVVNSAEDDEYDMDEYDDDVKDDDDWTVQDQSPAENSSFFWNIAQRFLQTSKRAQKKAERLKRKQEQRTSNESMKPYQLPKATGTDFYYAYDGSLTVPPCSERIWYRIMRKPLVISRSQLSRIQDLIAKHLDENCELGTVGKRLSDGTCHVDVSRPLQFTHAVHHVTDCTEWHEDDKRT